MTSPPILHINTLQFQYNNGDFTLQLPHLSVHTGQKVAIIGPSGTGKTTILQLIAGIRTPTSGHIHIANTPIQSLSDPQRRQFRISHIGFIFQDFQLLDYLNTLDNILHPYRLNPALTLTPATQNRATHLAHQMGIADKLNRPVTALSQGERQRVAICRALITQPQLLLADEATGNLDPTNKHRILNLLFDYIDQHQATLIAVTHDHDLLNRFDQVIDLQTRPPAPPTPPPPPQPQPTAPPTQPLKSITASLYLAWRYLSFHKLRTAILIACLSLVGALPLSLNLLLTASEQELMARAAATPLIIGAKGSDLDLAINTLYFASEPPEPITMATVSQLQTTQLAQPIPLHTSFEARNFPIVGTTPNYFQLRQLTLATGQPFNTLGDAVIGAQVAATLGLKPGDPIVSTPATVFDFGGSYPLKMNIVGVLKRTYTADDRAVFTDIKTTWVIQGLGHGHQNQTPNAPDGHTHNPAAAKTNPASGQYTEITPENLASFHFHGDMNTFPVTAVIAVPKDAKAAAILRGRYQNQPRRSQIIQPTSVVEELLLDIFKIRNLLNIVFLVVMITTLIALFLVFNLSLKLRQQEIETSFKLGCSRGMIFRLLVAEVAMLLVLSTGCALILTASLSLFKEQITRSMLA